MRSSYIMRYYHPFPEAIPLSEAGCSRVTHPSATKIQKQAHVSPFDLHVLGVPPAFVLSQDQTLHRVVSPNQYLYQFWNLLIANRSQLLLWFYTLFWVLIIDSNSLESESTRVPVFLAFLYCSVFKMQRFHSPGFLTPSPWQLIYYITSPGDCQGFSM